MEGNAYSPVILCSVCAAELKVIPNSDSKGYGWCKVCQCWQPGVQ